MKRTLGIRILLAILSLCARHLCIAQPMDRITLSPDGTSFITVSGKPFHPWGFNYDRDFKMRLLEDYWAAEWDTVVADFGEMRSLGANTVRIHLQFARFMTAADKPDEPALAKLRKLLALAEREDLYLDITGLACYRRADVPDWYADLDEHARWAAQASFWSAIAAACSQSPAVFCYDLVNEPAVPSKPLAARHWLIGDLGPFTYCQFLTLDPAGRAGDDIARAWARQMIAAIRKHDPKRLVTLGMLPNTLRDSPKGSCGFDVDAIAKDLDFVAVHFYPESGKFERDLAWLKRFAVGKPLVVEETFPLGCKPGELGQFIDRASAVNGWISFYWGRSPVELSASKNVADAITADWLDTFQKHRPP
ncbi:MAG TPA: cellulase family glycosylhydrolase [Tepidisphaeraceae bacterium]